jgi:sec-independent protein translocase protein TatC
MTLVEHLAELRHRLVLSLLAFVAGAITTYALYSPLLKALRQPLCRSTHGHCSLYVTAPLEAFGVRLDVAAYGGAILALPVIVYELWKFVTPGLKAGERRYALPFVFATFVLFCCGATVAWVTFPHALGFLKAAGGGGISEIFSPGRYLSLLGALVLIFGLTFEFPVVLVALQLAGVITPAKLSHWRRIAIVAIVVTAGVITPSSDPFSMLALAVPMLIFYEASIIIGRLLKR